jgi:glycosyltransferase involved in cell wall biosynthesis
MPYHRAHARDLPDPPALARFGGKGLRRHVGWISAASRLLHRLYLACPVWLQAFLRVLAPAHGREWVRRRFVPLLDARTAPLALRRPGVARDAADLSLFGPWRAMFGVAESARAYVHACLASGLKIDLHDMHMSGMHAHAEARLESLITAVPTARVQLLCCNADTLLGFGPVHRAGAWPGHYRIGHWYWELERFPRPWLAALGEVDELWAASPYVQAMLEAETAKPVLLMPPPVDFEVPRAYTRAEFGLPAGAFVCLFSYDFSAGTERKNPRACIEAFCRAFPAGTEDALLLIKTLYAERDPRAFGELAALARADARIMLLDRAYARADFLGLQSVCDAYLSLHRAEGYGLGLAEAMRLGKPVVATGYSGNLAFMNAGNSCLVDYRRVPVAPGAYRYAEGLSWAEPDVEHAAYHLRRLYEDAAYRAVLGARATAHMREHFSHAGIGARIRARLREFGADSGA